eukprot:jgi/Mesvir1/3210/Mv16362-RA.1
MDWAGQGPEVYRQVSGEGVATSTAAGDSEANVTTGPVRHGDDGEANSNAEGSSITNLFHDGDDEDGEGGVPGDASVSRQGALLEHSADAMERLCCGMLREGDVAVQVATLGRRWGPWDVGAGKQGSCVSLLSNEEEAGPGQQGLAGIGKQVAGSPGVGQAGPGLHGGAVASGALGGDRPRGAGDTVTRIHEATGEGASEPAVRISTGDTGTPLVGAEISWEQEALGDVAGGIGESGPHDVVTEGRIGSTSCMHCRVVRAVRCMLDRSGGEGMSLGGVCAALLEPGGARSRGCGNGQHSGDGDAAPPPASHHRHKDNHSGNATAAALRTEPARSREPLPQPCSTSSVQKPGRSAVLTADSDGLPGSGIRSGGGNAGVRNRGPDDASHAEGPEAGLEDAGDGRKAVERALLALQAFDLAVQVNGVGEPTYVSARHAEPYLAVLPHPQDLFDDRYGNAGAGVGAGACIPELSHKPQSHEQQGATTAAAAAAPSEPMGNVDHSMAGGAPVIPPAVGATSSSSPVHNKSADAAEDNSPGRADGELLSPAATLVVRPWHTGQGGVDEGLLTGMRRRVLTLLMRYPGMPEEAILQWLPQLTSTNTKQLLDVMVADGLIHARTSWQPSSAVPGMLRRQKDERQVITKHYFVDPKALLQA